MNPLVQRVRRHANMGVLFRSRDTGATARGLTAAATSPTDSLTGLPLVRATLFPLPSWVNPGVTASPAIQTMPSLQRQRMTFAPMRESGTEVPAWRSSAMSAPAEPRLSENISRQSSGSLPAVSPAAAPASIPYATPPIMRQTTPVTPVPNVTTAAASGAGSSAIPVPIMRTAAFTTPAPFAAAPTQNPSVGIPQTPGPLPVTASSQPPAPTPVVMRTTESVVAAPPAPAPALSSPSQPGQASPAPAQAGPEPTLTTEWSRLETIMRLHKDRAAEQGAEGGVIPAPPQPETTHLQTMMEKQKRLYSPSRMPPPELRRRAEVLTLSPDEIKSRGGDISPPSASVEPPIQRAVTGGTETSPLAGTSEMTIDEAAPSALQTAAAPESPTVQLAIPETAASSTLQRQVATPSETTTPAVDLSVGGAEPSVPSTKPIIQTQAEPTATPQPVQPVMKELVVTETPMVSATSTVTSSDAAAPPTPTTSAPIQRQTLTVPDVSVPGPVATPTPETTQPPDITRAAAEMPIQRSLVEPLTASTISQPEITPTVATLPSDSPALVAGITAPSSEVTPAVQRQEMTSSGGLVEATANPAMPTDVPSVSPVPLMSATPAIQRQELSISKPMAPETEFPGDRPTVSQPTEGILAGRPSSVPETVATPVQRQTVSQEQAATLSVQTELPAVGMSSTSPLPVVAPLPVEGPQHPVQPLVPTTPSTASTVQRQMDPAPMVAEVGGLSTSAPETSQPLPSVTPVQRASAHESVPSTVDMPLPVVRARPVSETILSPATTYQRTPETGRTMGPSDANIPPVGLEIQPEAATSLPAVLPSVAPVTRSEIEIPMQRAAATPVPAIPASGAGTELVTPVQRAAATPMPTMSSIATPVAGGEPVTSVQRAAATPIPTVTPSAIPVAGGEPITPVQRAAATPIPTVSPLATPVAGGEPVTPVQRAAATPVSTVPPLAIPVAETESVTPVQRTAATPVSTVSPLATPVTETESVTPVQRAAATPVPTVSPLATPVAETESVTPVQRAAAIPVPTVPPLAIPGTETESVTPVQRAAATPMPTADTHPVAKSEMATPIQREAAPIPSSGELDETDMPTMIMPVPVVVSQSAPASAETAFSPAVVRENQGIEAVQRQVGPVSPVVTSQSPETIRPIQPPAAPSTERLALEDVWPVQRKETSAVKAGDLPIDPVEVAEPVRHEKPEAARIEQVMRQVAAAKTSDSSVELILPRRQRPHVPARPATPLPAVQTQPAAPKDGNGHKGQGDGSSVTPQAYVPTEIGPLPGDLWEILGAPMPSPIRPTGQTDSPALMRAVAAAEQPVASAKLPADYAPVTTTNGNTNGHTHMVQREPVAPNSDTGQSQPSSVATVQSGMPLRTASTQEGGEGGEQGEVNVEELARQVYSEVKRRLAIDWERGRGRF